MGTVKAKEIQKTEVLRLEAEMNNLWGELNTSNVPHGTRMDLEKRLSVCEEQFKAVLGGQASLKQLEKELKQCDLLLALAAIQQAENEVPKTEHTASSFQALENIRHELKEGAITPIKARHELKEIMRHHG